MSDLASAEEFRLRYHANYHADGKGLAVSAVHMPCPFCAAPDWMCYRVFDGIPEHDHACGACGRTARIIRARSGGVTRLELLQTGGDDPPGWLEPTPRRIQDDDDE